MFNFRTILRKAKNSVSKINSVTKHLPVVGSVTNAVDTLGKKVWDTARHLGRPQVELGSGHITNHQEQMRRLSPHPSPVGPGLPPGTTGSNSQGYVLPDVAVTAQRRDGINIGVDWGKSSSGIDQKTLLIGAGGIAVFAVLLSAIGGNRR